MYILKRYGEIPPGLKILMAMMYQGNCTTYRGADCSNNSSVILSTAFRVFRKHLKTKPPRLELFTYSVKKILTG